MNEPHKEGTGGGTTTLHGDLLTRLLSAFSVLSLNFMQNQNVSQEAWKFLLSQEMHLKSLNALCIARKIIPPEVPFNHLKQSMAQPRTIPVLAGGTIHCLMAMHSLSQLIRIWSTLLAKTTAKQIIPSTGVVRH